MTYRKSRKTNNIGVDEYDNLLSTENFRRANKEAASKAQCQDLNDMVRVPIVNGFKFIKNK
jgi:hypothetical protein